jgi:hypothetical protein
MKEIIEFRIAYNIGDFVYHSVDPESKKGIITNILFNTRYKEVKYVVSFGLYADQETNLLEEELSMEKAIEY